MPSDQRGSKVPVRGLLRSSHTMARGTGGRSPGTGGGAGPWMAAAGEIEAFKYNIFFILI